MDELDSNLTLTCTMIDLICELLSGITSNNTLQQEAVVRWTKLLFGNISEPILQVRSSHAFRLAFKIYIFFPKFFYKLYLQKTILWLFDSLNSSSLVCNASHDITSQTNVQSKDKLLRLLEEKISYDIKLIFGEDDAHKALKYLLNSCEIKKINMDVNMQMLDAVVSEILISCKTNHDTTN